MATGKRELGFLSPARQQVAIGVEHRLCCELEAEQVQRAAPFHHQAKAGRLRSLGKEEGAQRSSPGLAGCRRDAVVPGCAGSRQEPVLLAYKSNWWLVTP